MHGRLHIGATMIEDTYAITDDGVLLTINDGELIMRSDVNAQGPIQVIGGAWSAFELAKKYGPWAMALIAWLVIAIPYMLGKSDKVPGLPPIMPQGIYVSDGVHPLVVATPEAVAAAKLK